MEGQNYCMHHLIHNDLARPQQCEYVFWENMRPVQRCQERAVGTTRFCHDHQPNMSYKERAVLDTILALANEPLPDSQLVTRKKRSVRLSE